MKFKFNVFAFILGFLFVMCTTGCKEPTPTPPVNNPCITHVDYDNDKVCDKCGDPYDPTPVDPIIEVKSTTANITIIDEELEYFNFKDLFTITKDGKNIAVLDEYVDSSKVNVSPGSYTVTCNYEGKSASVTVEVKKTIYNVVLYVEQITINVSLVNTYDYLSLFVATKDGKVMTITDDMITNGVIAEVGSYSYVVSNHGVSATLTVNVTNDHDIEVVETYNNVEIYYDELLEFDYTNLFSLYVNKSAVQVIPEMIDLSNLENAEIGNSYKITLKYEIGTSKISYDIDVKVIASEEVNITSKNLIIYPNSEFIDLCSLFEIKVGNKLIPVTNDMITGSIEYTKVGINEITLKYLDYTKVATVEVKKGVIIDYRYSDVISIVKGQNQNTYDFANDFKVVVNGVEMNIIPESYLDLSNVDFSTPGTYEVMLTIPYNDKAYGLSGVKFSYHKKTITYVVVNNDYQINIQNELIEFPKGTTEYDIYKNIKVVINGKNQTLTEIPEYASVIACYVQTLSDTIDFNKPGLQEVKIAVYVNGPENEPVIVTYYVIMQTDLLIESIDKVVFTGDTIYTKDLFVITEDGVNIDTPSESLSGKVDVFTPGVYEIHLSYMGIEETSRVVVLDREIIGTYKTLLTTIPTIETNDSDEDVTIPGKLLSDLIIKEDCSLSVLGKTSTIINAIDENTLVIKVGPYNYTLYYENGIVVIDPENDIRLTYNDEKRPAIYFKTDTYQILEKFTVNSTDKHVLMQNMQSYSIDTFKIQRTSDYSQMWFGLKVEITYKMGADTVYSATWGETVFDESFVNDINKQSSLTMNNTTYPFKVLTKGNAKILKVDNTKVYANMIFNGTYNGVSAMLFVDQYGGYTFKSDDEVYCIVGSYDLSQMKIGGADPSNNTVLLYGFNEEIFSYKLLLNLDDNTFECAERDDVFGKYQYGSYMFFLDGYGSGIFKDDVKSYYEYPFTYEVNGKEIVIKYFNVNFNFAYGESATLYMDDFGNTLTVGYFENDSIIGKKFENQKVIDGAIVRVNTQKIGANTDTNAKAELYKNIEIITKDGVITGDSVKNYVTTSFIRFNTPGFYEFTIKVNVKGVDVIGYYALQIIGEIYADSSVVGTYNGLTTDAAMIIDKYGFAIIQYAGDTYSGLAKIDENNSFVVNAYNESHKSITLTGETLSRGLVRVRCSGAIAFNDYLTTGSNDIIGCEGVVLRTVLVGTERTFILSSSQTNLGSIVNVELISGTSELVNGSIIKIYDDNSEKIVKTVSWGNSKSGLVISDPYRGTYVSSDKEDVFIDGFGKATIGNKNGTYDLNGAVVTIDISADTFVYRLNNETFTYEIVDVVLDNTLLQGKVLSASYTFYCSDYPYTASTSFEFKSDGVVVIKSSSSSHDDGEDSCTEDLYSPVFASNNGVNGKYYVKGNKVTIEVSGYIFTFKIKNVLKGDEIICLSTTVDSSSHGYFKTDTVFK